MGSKTTQKSQSEFRKAFKVFKFEGRRWQLTTAILVFIFSFVITVPMSFVTLIIRG
jgi:hypothetical protein